MAYALHLEALDSRLEYGRSEVDYQYRYVCLFGMVC